MAEQLTCETVDCWRIPIRSNKDNINFEVILDEKKQWLCIVTNDRKYMSYRAYNRNNRKDMDHLLAPLQTAKPGYYINLPTGYQPNSFDIVQVLQCKKCVIKDTTIYYYNYQKTNTVLALVRNNDIYCANDDLGKYTFYGYDMSQLQVPDKDKVTYDEINDIINKQTFGGRPRKEMAKAKPSSGIRSKSPASKATKWTSTGKKVTVSQKGTDGKMHRVSRMTYKNASKPGEVRIARQGTDGKRCYVKFKVAEDKPKKKSTPKKK
jgi:hypothetical protein